MGRRLVVVPLVILSGLLPGLAAMPVRAAGPVKTATLSAVLDGTSSIEFPGGYEITNEVMTGTFVDARYGRGTYRIDATMVEREFGFGISGAFVLRFRGRATLSGALLVPDAGSGGALDGTLVVESGTGRFRGMTGELVFHLDRSGAFNPPDPVFTSDSGTVSGTLLWVRPARPRA